MFPYDFAISYAGEDETIASKIYEPLKEKYSDFVIFFAKRDRNKIIGKDGEEFFENLFKTAKQVIVILSESYKKKDWPRYEWDIIRERDKENRCIPIKIDDVKILGLPSNFIYLKFTGDYEDIAILCIEKLITFEIETGIQRESEFQKLTDAIKDSKGSIDKSVQLVYDHRERSPLNDIKFPKGNFSKSYEVVNVEELPYSRINRLIIKINLPDNLTKEEIAFNIKYCTAEYFNDHKPDAIGIFVYSSEASNFLGYNKYNIARADFAPFGDWAQAEDGFAYNIPSEKFDWKIDYEDSYFDKTKNIKTAEDLARDLILETLKKRKNKS